MYCAIDFGTSNSGIAVPAPDMPGGAVQLLEIEPGHPTLPTAVFYAVEGLAPHEVPRRLYGRAAVAAYVEGTEGRLMRSMKSILGSSLLDQRTDLGAGHSVTYQEVVAGYLRQLKQQAEAHLGAPITQAVLGRPVLFVDDDPARDAQAQAALEAAARSVGFAAVHFQYEPIATALAEQGKIDVADGGQAHLALDAIEPGLAVMLTQARAIDAIGADLERVVDAAGDTLRQAGLGPDAVDALYLTGGSTGLTPLAQRLAAVCPAAQLVRGDRFASVACGLGLHAQRLLAPTPR